MRDNTRSIKSISKKEHAPGRTCSICGHNYKGITFKSGYVCETCLDYIKDSYSTDAGSTK